MISSIAVIFEEMEPMRDPYQTLSNGENSIYGDKCHGKILCLDQHFSTERNAMY